MVALQLFSTGIQLTPRVRRDPAWVLALSCLPRAAAWGRDAAPSQLLTLPFLSPFWQTDGEGDLVSEADAWSAYRANSSIEGEARIRLPVSCQTQEMVFNLQLTCTAGAKLHTNVKHGLFLPWLLKHTTFL